MAFVLHFSPFDRHWVSSPNPKKNPCSTKQHTFFELPMKGKKYYRKKERNASNSIFSFPEDVFIVCLLVVGGEGSLELGIGQ